MPPSRPAEQRAAASHTSEARRAVVPQAAARSLWSAAAWTGAGTALIGAVGAIAVVAVCWLPASGASGHTSATLKAGVLSFLAALHGGVTVDGSPSRFVPLGMTMLVAALLYRGGSGLGDAAEALGERDPVRLLVAAAVQAAAFSTTCLLLAVLARLGTSSAPLVGVGLASLVLSGAVGTWGLARACQLGGAIRALVPPLAEDIARSAAAALLVYLIAGALLTAASLIVHHSQVATISGEVGGGWSGVPILALGILSVPNAVISGVGYLAGPGFAVGAGTTVSLRGAAHGLVPAFPLLGALPKQPAGPPVWILAVAVPLVATWLAVRLLPDRRTWRELARDFGLVALAAGLAMGVLAWQAGGGIGSGRLATIGASPWRVAVAIGVTVAAGQWLVIGSLTARQWYSERRARLAAEATVRADALEDDVNLPVESTTGEVVEAVDGLAESAAEVPAGAAPAATESSGAGELAG
jgi:Family of unknown function (DUF6350)